MIEKTMKKKSNRLHKKRPVCLARNEMKRESVAIFEVMSSHDHDYTLLFLT